MTQPVPTPRFSIDQSRPRGSAASKGDSVSPISVLIVDDHPAICEALSAAIDGADGIQVLGTAGNVDATLAFLEGHTPDVVVVDISLADGSGLSLINSIEARTPSARVLVYSMYDGRVYADQSLRAGALGFVPKSTPTTDLLTAIHVVSRGEVYVSKKMESKIVRSVAGRGTYVTDPEDQLSDRELTVFKMIGSGNSVREIANHLKLSRKTVETYRRHVKQKLGYETVDELLRFAVLWTE